MNMVCPGGLNARLCACWSTVGRSTTGPPLHHTPTGRLTHAHIHTRTHAHHLTPCLLLTPGRSRTGLVTLSDTAVVRGTWSSGTRPPGISSSVYENKREFGLWPLLALWEGQRCSMVSHCITLPTHCITFTSFGHTANGDKAAPEGRGRGGSQSTVSPHSAARQSGLWRSGPILPSTRRPAQSGPH